MKKHLYIHICALLLGGVWLASCRHSDAQMSPNENSTYISTILSQDGVEGLRAQTNHSVNKDLTDNEDKVNTLAMLVFPTGRMERSAFYYSDNFAGVIGSRIPATKVDAGNNDFYFFANIERSAVENLLTRDEVEAYLSAGHAFATDHRSVGFPMSRVYYNQQIPGGHSASDPFVWAPQVADMMPVTTGEDPLQGSRVVGLVRACAKVSLTISGEGLKDIVSVEYHNALSKYTMKRLTLSGYQQIPASSRPKSMYSIPSTAPERPLNLLVYVPERLCGRSQRANDRWDNTNDIGVNGVNYIQITTKAGKVYRFPIVHAESTPAGVSYTDYAKGKNATKPVYDVVRNHHYHFNVTVPPDDKKLDVTLQILPWTLIESERSYERPSYEIEIIPDGMQKQTKIGQEVRLTDMDKKTARPVTIRFKITSPRGSVWTATITNGRDFILEGGHYGVLIDGIVSGEAEWHTFRLIPRNPYDGEPKYTQFYITIEGKEIYLGLDDSGRPVNRYIGDGSSERWRFIQIRRNI